MQKIDLYTNQIFWFLLLWKEIKSLNELKKWKTY